MAHVSQARARSPRWYPKFPTATVTYGGNEYTVVYEYHRAERPNYNADSPTAGPGCPAAVEAIEIWLGEYELCDVLDVKVITALEARVLEGLDGERP